MWCEGGREGKVNECRWRKGCRWMKKCRWKGRVAERKYGSRKSEKRSLICGLRSAGKDRDKKNYRKT